MAKQANRKRHTHSVLGYDPGGNPEKGISEHGVACLALSPEGDIQQVQTHALPTAEDAVRWLLARPTPVAIGIDTLTILSTGPGGWRPADRALRHHYPGIANSVMAPNSLPGAVACNGLAVMLAMRLAYPACEVTEAHPKVVYFELNREKNKPATDSLAWWEMQLGVPVAPAQIANGNAFDALLSALSAWRGFRREWPGDLHALTPCEDERLIYPNDIRSRYWWPIELEPAPSASQKRKKR
ncbi:MAG: hypothetical protein AB7K09_09425 [Planctomycetota bacterium]